jgi:hypothetical protein
MNASSDIASIWTLVMVLGPILFLAVLSWAVMRSFRRTRSEHDLTEQAPRDVYDQSDRKSKVLHRGES